MRASGAAPRRILVKAATPSPKNITPNAEVNKSYSSSAAVAGSTCRQSTLAMPAALARLSPSASIGPEMSNPTTRPEGPTARANSSVGAPQPQPISTTRSPARGAAKASKASITGASVVSVCSLASHPGVAALTVPEGKHGYRSRLERDAANASGIEAMIGCKNLRLLPVLRNKPGFRQTEAILAHAHCSACSVQLGRR